MNVCNKSAPFDKEYWYRRSCDYLTELQDMTSEKVKLEQQLKEKDEALELIVRTGFYVPVLIAEEVLVKYKKERE